MRRGCSALQLGWAPVSPVETVRCCHGQQQPPPRHAWQRDPRGAAVQLVRARAWSTPSCAMHSRRSRTQTPRPRRSPQGAGRPATSQAIAAAELGLPIVTALLAPAPMLGSDHGEPWGAEVALRAAASLTRFPTQDAHKSVPVHWLPQHMVHCIDEISHTLGFNVLRSRNTDQHHVVLVFCAQCHGQF